MSICTLIYLSLYKLEMRYFDKQVLATRKEELKPVHTGFHPSYEYDKHEVSPSIGIIQAEHRCIFSLKA